MALGNMRSAAFLFLPLLVACGADTLIAPRTVASIVVASPIGTRLAVGRTTQLVAEARDASGAAIDNVTLTWTSTSNAAATVSSAGLVSGMAAGTTTIEVTGAGVTGTIALQVIAADLDGVVATANDDFAKALVANLSPSVRTKVEQALGQIASGVGAGNFTTIEAGLTAARAEVTSATDPTDRALLASLALFLDRIQVLMNL